MDKIIPVLTLLFAFSSGYARADTVSEANYFYIGGEIGISEPVIKKFEHESKTKISLKKSEMYGGKVGYRFYPGMMIEISGTRQPSYTLNYILPQTPINIPGIPGISIPETKGTTKTKGEVYTLNLVYETKPIFSGLKPYIIMGAGLAKVIVQAVDSNWDAPAPLPFGKLVFFKVRKTTAYRPVWQAGVGIAKELTDNFSVDFSTKLQVVHNVKIDYDTLNINTGGYTKAAPIKKTIAVGEFALGFTCKLPF